MAFTEDELRTDWERSRPDRRTVGKFRGMDGKTVHVRPETGQTSADALIGALVDHGYSSSMLDRLVREGKILIDNNE